MPLHLQYLCIAQPGYPVFRDVDNEYWSWEQAAAAALALLESGRRVIKIFDANGYELGSYDWNGRGQLMTGNAPRSYPGAVGGVWA